MLASLAGGGLCHQPLVWELAKYDNSFPKIPWVNGFSELTVVWIISRGSETFRIDQRSVYISWSAYVLDEQSLEPCRSAWSTAQRDWRNSAEVWWLRWLLISSRVHAIMLLQWSWRLPYVCQTSNDHRIVGHLGMPEKTHVSIWGTNRSVLCFGNKHDQLLYESLLGDKNENTKTSFRGTGGTSSRDFYH